MPDASTIISVVKDVLIIGALTALFVRQALHWRDGKKDTGSNGRSGDKSPSYWELTIGKLIESKLEQYDERIRKPERVEATNERRQIHIKLTQLAAAYELSIKEKERMLAEAIMEITRQVRRGNEKDGK